ncbi:MAG: tRNA-dihydrouridine synthase family protein, partial [Bdellovibrionales bacterium]|nr:tRNA-dihydrouridine synthase family protein [Bdellovibrionales bacterium]
KHNYGVALMGDIDYAKQVTSYAVSSSDLPVSVKIRAGLQKDRDFLAKFVLSLQAAGASWICLHPRLAEQKRRGHADWSQIQFVKQILDIPVIGNGDVQTSEDALKMFLETKCDGVMIGRALTARPWLLAQIATQLGVSSQSHWLHVSLEEEAYKYGEALMKFINLSEQFFNEVDGLKRLRFYIKVSHPWLNFGHSLYANAHRVNTYDQAREMIVDFFRASGLKMHNYTELKY